jgi:hypothetical protein
MEWADIKLEESKTISRKASLSSSKLLLPATQQVWPATFFQKTREMK